MNAAKIQLSSPEMRLVTDPEWILTKNSIIGKIVALMAALSEQYRPLWEGLCAAVEEGPHPSAPRISKGENYKGLPYVMLDYPRFFGREDVLAIRTMFWWGHYFSVTLHLKGRYLALFLPALRAQISLLSDAGFHVGVSEDEWRHELAQDNYAALEGLTAEDLDRMLTKTGFLKLSAVTGLDGEDAGGELLRLYELLVGVLAHA